MQFQQVGPSFVNSKAAQYNSQLLSGQGLLAMVDGGGTQNNTSTALGSLIVYVTPGGNNTFLASGWFTLNSVTGSTPTIALQATWTDEESTAQTFTFGSLTSAGHVTAAPVLIRCAGGSNLTILLALTAGSISAINYDAEGWILRVT